MVSNQQVATLQRDLALEASRTLQSLETSEHLRTEVAASQELHRKLEAALELAHQQAQVCGNQAVRVRTTLHASVARLM